ncbi:MAG: MoxR family ATPase [Candidatus Riflebacteria bacterium]|nr:MoxR family ATPase [Candidatus Riflebacteria bacterium]
MKNQAEYFSNVYTSLKKEVGKVVAGNPALVEDVLVAFFCGGHVLLEGLPGLGKTLLVKTISRVLGLQFSRIQFTPDLMPADIVGTTVVSQSTDGQRAFRFQKGPLFANLVLADEINRATAKTQSALLEAMAERQVTVGGTTYPLDEPFFVLGTQNPIEMDGTYPLPEAQLDRFMFKILVDFPDKDCLMAIVDRNITNTHIEVQSKTSAQMIGNIRELIRDVPIADPIKDYAAKLILATQPSSKFAIPITKKYLSYGASPRGILAIVHSAKARALLQGRLHVALEDVQKVALPALRHRLILNFEGEAEGITTDYVVEKLLEYERF